MPLEVGTCEHLSDIHKERVLKCALEVSKHLDCHWCHWCRFANSSEKLHASKGVRRGIYDLFILAAWNKLEDVDGLPFVTASTTSLPFIHVRHDRHLGNQTVCNEDDHVNSFLPGTSSGWEEPKRDQEELQCHHPENRWKLLKTQKNAENHALPSTL